MSEVVKTTIGEARELVSSQVLWPRVRDFLWDFAPQVHESWIEDLAAGKNLSGILRGLCDGDEMSSRLKRFLLDELGVEPFFHDFPKDDWSRLALLDGATLMEIAKWLGALACADDLRRVTDGTTVRELKLALRGVYPEVFSFTAYFAGLDLSAKGAKDAKSSERVVSVGLELLFSLLGACPTPVVDRLKLKLHKSLCALCVCSREKERSAAGNAVKKLLKLKFQEAYSLCCS